VSVIVIAVCSPKREVPAVDHRSGSCANGLPLEAHPSASRFRPNNVEDTSVAGLALVEVEMGRVPRSRRVARVANGSAV
jgi:hypothetical protein